MLAAFLKANKKLGFIRRSAFNIRDECVCKSLSLYFSSSQQSSILLTGVGPQAVNLILDVERIQWRATKVILSLPYRSEVSSKQKLLKAGLLPLCYWHEFLDLVYVVKCF